MHIYKKWKKPFEQCVQTASSVFWKNPFFIIRMAIPKFSLKVVISYSSRSTRLQMQCSSVLHWY